MTSSMHESSILSVKEILGRLLSFPILSECHKDISLFYIKSKGIFATGFNEGRIRTKILTEGLLF